MAVGVDAVVESIDELARIVSERDGFDVATLVITALSVLATLGAVFVALRASREAKVSADAALAVSGEAAIAAKASAEAARDLLAVENSRSASEYDRTLTKPMEEFIDRLQAWRERLWLLKQAGGGDSLTDDDRHQAGRLQDATLLLRIAVRGNDRMVVTALDRALSACSIMHDDALAHRLLGEIGGELIDWRSGGESAGDVSLALVRIRVEALRSGQSLDTPDDLDPPLGD